MNEQFMPSREARDRLVVEALAWQDAELQAGRAMEYIVVVNGDEETAGRLLWLYAMDNANRQGQDGADPS